MIYKGFRLSESMVRDMKYVAHKTGMSETQIARQGITIVIDDFYQKEKDSRQANT